MKLYKISTLITILCMLIPLFSNVIEVNAEGSPTSDNSASATSIFSGMGRYQVVEYNDGLQWQEDTETNKLATSQSGYNISIRSNQKLVKAYVGINNENITDTYPISIKTPDGTVVTLKDNSFSFVHGQASYVDVTNLINKYGNGKYSIVNYPYPSTNQAPGWYSAPMVAVVEDPTLDYNAVVINDFSAGDAGVSSVDGTTSVSAPNGYVMNRGSNISISTNVSTWDSGDGLSMSYTDDSGNKTEAYNSKSGAYDKWIKTSTTTTNSTSKLDFSIHYQNNISGAETMQFIVIQASIQRAGATYNYTNQAGNGIGDGIKVSSTQFTDLDKGSIYPTIGTKGTIHLVGSAGTNIPDLQYENIPGYTFLSKNTTGDKFVDGTDIITNYLYSGTPQTINVKYVDDYTGKEITSLAKSYSGKTGDEFTESLSDYKSLGYDFVKVTGDTNITSNGTKFAGNYTTTLTDTNTVENDQQVTVRLTPSKPVAGDVTLVTVPSFNYGPVTISNAAKNIYIHDHLENTSVQGTDILTIQDNRKQGTLENSGWTVTAKMSNFVNSYNENLSGATLTDTKSNIDLIPHGDATVSTMSLVAGGDSCQLLQAINGQGVGKTSYNYDKSTMDIPATSSNHAGEYSGTITYTLQTTP